MSRSSTGAALLLGVGLWGGCSATPWADTVISAVADDGLYGDPSLAANGARGAGCCAGGTDVYSIDPDRGRPDLVLRFDRPVMDGPGDDLAVFENPFTIEPDSEGREQRFMDPVVVSVSADGEAWAVFPHHYDAPDPTRWSADPTHWVGFAGITPVLLNEDDNEDDNEDAPEPIAASDREAAGGDGFDLASLPESPATAGVVETGVRFVRLEPATAYTDPTTGQPYPADPISDGPDIDAVYGW